MIQSNTMHVQISEQIKKINDAYPVDKKISKFILLKDFISKNKYFNVSSQELACLFLETIKNYHSDLLRNEKLQNDLLEIMVFLFEINKSKYSIARSPEFLVKIKEILKEDSLNIIIKKFNLNYSSKEIKVFTLKNYLNKRIPFNLTINSNEEIDKLINDLNNFININKINTQQIEDENKNRNNIFLLNFIQEKEVKVTEKDLIICFQNTWRMVGKESQNYFIFDLFADIFKETNVFKNSFATTNKMNKKMRIFFNMDEMNKIKNKENLIDYICNHPNLYKEKLENQLQRLDKIKMFSKSNLSKKEVEIFNDNFTEKENMAIKRIKI